MKVEVWKQSPKPIKIWSGDLSNVPYKGNYIEYQGLLLNILSADWDSTKKNKFKINVR